MMFNYALWTCRSVAVAESFIHSSTNATMKKTNTIRCTFPSPFCCSIHKTSGYLNSSMGTGKADRPFARAGKNNPKLNKCGPYSTNNLLLLRFSLFPPFIMS